MIQNNQSLKYQEKSFNLTQERALKVAIMEGHSIAADISIHIVKLNKFIWDKEKLKIMIIVFNQILFINMIR